MQIPKDAYEMTEKYRIDKGGICGQACLAAITGKTIQTVLDEWKAIGIEFKGWSGWNQLREYLTLNGYVVRQKKAEVKYIPRCYYIARVQWIGDGVKKEKPFYGWNHWSMASTHTHFITIHQGEYFCNESGKFPLGQLPEYLETLKGVITSHFEISKDECPECHKTTDELHIGTGLCKECMQNWGWRQNYR